MFQPPSLNSRFEHFVQALPADDVTQTYRRQTCAYGAALLMN